MRVLLLLHLPIVFGDFSPDFNAFLERRYGVAVRQQLERQDFSYNGSFGGKIQPEEIMERRPVIIVHGVTNVAGHFMHVRKKFLDSGYKEGEMRSMIDAVYHYANDTKVDVIAFSMGSPITRKAILGGKCGSDDLGEPLTHMVDTFIGVAGANYGSSFCFLPFFLCSKRNGLHCDSKFLKELNSQDSRYEGDRSFAIYTDADNKVGRYCCGKRCSSIPHSTAEFEVSDWDHDEVFTNTIDLQLTLLEHSGIYGDLM